MKKILLATMLCILATQAYAKSPMQAVKVRGAEVHITSLQNNLKINSVQINRGNCSPIIGLSKGQLLNYGEKTLIISVDGSALGVKNKGGETIYALDLPQKTSVQLDSFIAMGMIKHCPILEIVVETNAGQWTFSWENQ